VALSAREEGMKQDNDDKHKGKNALLKKKTGGQVE